MDGSERSCGRKTRRIPSAHRELTPNETGAPDVGSVDVTAGGLDAIRSSVGYAIEQAGLGRASRVLLQVNQSDGFDCPGCAWPDPHHRAMAEFCESGARAVADEATVARVTPEFFARRSISSLLTEPDHWLNRQGRLTQPMLKRAGSNAYEPVGWEEAFARIAHHLRDLDDPREAIFYTSGRTSNEAAFLYQLFVRQFGCNNLPDCSNMCHHSSAVGLSEVLGVGKGTVLLDDFARADAIFVVGQNPGTNHPRMLTALREAKLRGCKIVAINPLREPGLVRFKHPQKLGDMLTGGVEIADLYLRVRVGGDIALFKGIMKAMLAEERRGHEVFDHDFIAVHTRGYRKLIADLEATSWPVIQRNSGVPRAQIEEAARIAIEADATIACWAMGITQHRHGVANVQTIVDFLLLRGNMGRPGAGVCPVMGHSNVQGDRTMGIAEHPPAWSEALGQQFSFSVPEDRGLDTVGAIEAMHDGRARVFFALGGNFVSASPDTDYTAEALRNCDLTVQVSTKLNRTHLVTGREAIILPCLGRTERDARGSDEQFVTVENSMGVVHRSRGNLAPASEHLLSEPQIVARLARTTLGVHTEVPWEDFADDYSKIRAAIASIVPGFENYEDRVGHRGGFVLDNGARERRFATQSGKAEFRVHPLPDLGLDDDRVWLTTVRSHDQFNTTIYGLDDRQRGVWGHRHVIFMHGDDMQARGLHTGDRVMIRSHFEDQIRTARRFIAVEFDVPRGNAAAYFPEANVLVPVGSYAHGSRTPASKAIAVTVEKEV
jgi:molybdopterin-dependent oxidoreductase alpha subunit